MISKAIDRSIKNTSINRLRLNLGEYEWAGAGVIISNYGTTMI